MNWDAELDREIWVRFGPFDESDEVNHDPDSLVGEEDESGFDEQSWARDWTDWQTYDDAGFDDAGAEDDDEGEDDGGDEEEE